MANALYRQVAPDTWLNQAQAGGPDIIRITADETGEFNVYVSYNGGAIFYLLQALATTNLTTATQAVTAYIAALTAGTA